MQMTVYQFCEIAQMLECNSQGLLHFYQLILRGYAWLTDAGKQFVLSIINWFKNKWRQLKQLIFDYTVKDASELSKDELKGQLDNMSKIIYVVSGLAALIVVRVIIKRARFR